MKLFFLNANWTPSSTISLLKALPAQCSFRLACDTRHIRYSSTTCQPPRLLLATLVVIATLTCPMVPSTCLSYPHLFWTAWRVTNSSSNTGPRQSHFIATRLFVYLFRPVWPSRLLFAFTHHPVG